MRSRTSPTSVGDALQAFGGAAQRVADRLRDALGEVAQLRGDVAEQPGQGLQQERRVEDGVASVFRKSAGTTAAKSGEKPSAAGSVSTTSMPISPRNLVALPDTDGQPQPGAGERITSRRRRRDRSPRRAAAPQSLAARGR